MMAQIKAFIQRPWQPFEPLIFVLIISQINILVLPLIMPEGKPVWLSIVSAVVMSIAAWFVAVPMARAARRMLGVE
jgi:hypothetical protein